MTGDEPTRIDLDLAAEELAVLARGNEETLALLRPELAEVPVLDVVRRTMVARGLLLGDGDGGTKPTGMAARLADALGTAEQVLPGDPARLRS